MPADLAMAVADAFGLGTPTGPPRPVPGGRSHRLWRLSTTRGGWAVKRLNRPREQWWLDDYLLAARIQIAAHHAGIAMPRPISPVRPAAALLADVPVDGALASFLAHEWCAGHALKNTDIAPPVLDWVGATLAALHSLPAVPASADATTHEPHGVEEWRDWLDNAPLDASPDFVRAVRAHLPDIARAKDIVDNARSMVGHELTPVFTHRDVKPDNVLVTPTSPLLVDWDGAGLDVAEWEATRAALAFSRTTTSWDRDAFATVLRAYAAAGGRTIAPRGESFAGQLRAQLSGAAWMLFRALGHRPVSPTERAAAHEHALELLAALSASLPRMEQWTRWLHEITRSL